MRVREVCRLEMRENAWTGNSRVCLQSKATIETAQGQPPSIAFEKPAFSFRESYKNFVAILYEPTLLALELGGRLSTIFLVVSAPDRSIVLHRLPSSSSCDELPPNDVTMRSRDIQSMAECTRQRVETKSKR